MTEDALEKARQKIDDIDNSILSLIEKRATLALEIADIKSQQKSPVYYRPEREAQILRDILNKHHSLLDTKIIAKIFKELISGCLNLQKQMTVAYLGPQGTFSQIATETHFGQGVATLPENSIEAIFQAVSEERADYGIVPIENSTAGSINTTLDLLINTPLHICGEVELPIHHHLLRQKGDDSTIQCIYAHEQTLAQCRQTLNQYFPNIQTQSTSSNSQAAEQLLTRKGYAMIGADLLATLYDLEIVKQHLEDSPHNRTRFIIIGQRSPAPSGNDKTSLLIATPQSAGSLINLIKPFQTHGISMTTINSRPYQHHNWSYLFFIDIQGHQSDEQVKLALDTLSKQAMMLTILGSYPRAVI